MTTSMTTKTLIHVTPLESTGYRVQVGPHVLTIDQPASADGHDQGPTPVELFVASLAACVAHYAGSYLARHGLSSDGLDVAADFVMAEDRPARVASVSVTITSAASPAMKTLPQRAQRSPPSDAVSGT